MCGRKAPPLTGYTVSNNTYTCIKCSNNYKSKSSLRRHIVYECGKAPSVTCPVSGCTYKSKHKARMTQHVQMVHKLSYIK